ncbi:MAG: FtsH protease activity modulator HflK [Deltaproteobacteria bacterium]|nr:FtsH protease activity modulator HflK [Deltaproteobacteria bacterium]
MSNKGPIDLSQYRVPRLGRFLPSGGFPVVVVILVVFIIFTSWYQIGPESVGVVLRLGAYNRTVDPGLHFKLPMGIERVYTVQTQRQMKEEFGFRTLRPGINTQYAVGDFDDESLMLTGDLNVAVVEWTVQFRIVDPYKFLFRVRDVGETFRYMTQAVMREVVGDRTVNEVLTVGRSELALDVADRLQLLCDQYETGLRVDQVILQDVTPPEEVKPSFNEVNQAQQEKEKLINQARAEYNRVIPKARGEALQTVQQAEGYAINRVNRAKGEAERFKRLYAEYQKAPEVTSRRMYVEMMEEVLPKVGHKIIVDDKAKNIIPLLPLGENLFGSKEEKGDGS